MSISLFGGFSLTDKSGKGQHLPTRKAEIVLAVLVLSGNKGRPREALAEMVWPDRSDGQAKSSLRQALTAIRKILPQVLPEYELRSDRSIVVLAGPDDLLDVRTFDGLDDGASTDTSIDAADLYAGDLLDGVDMQPSLLAWVSPRRESYRRQALSLVENLSAAASLTDGVKKTCEDLANRLLASDPAAEEAHRALIRLRLAEGQTNAARRQVERCIEAVRDEYGAEPEDTTRALADQIDVSESDRAETTESGPQRVDSGDALQLPDSPSIAVLPFDNLSGDPEKEYFGDGIAEDIITGLSRFRLLLVTARTSSFAFKGKTVDARQVARELNVRYVLEGSVRLAGARIRVTAQLIDSAGGSHIWVERYDRDLDDLFEVQDEITEAIVAAIEPKIGRMERDRSQRKPLNSLDTWGLYQRGLSAYYASTEEGLNSAIEVFDQVNELDPYFQAAFAMAAESRVRHVMFYRADERTALLEQAKQKAQRGISLDPGDPLCLLADGRVSALLGQFDLAISQIGDAIALNPNHAMAHYILGWALFEAGRHEEAIPPLDDALRLSPHDAFLSGFQHIRARALFALQRYQECIEWEHRATRSPNAHLWAFVTLAAALFRLGREDEARDVVADLLRRAPHFSISFMKSSFSKEDPLDDKELIKSFRRAGIPELGVAESR
jgi:TolB-like protein/Flp pilus assembly protein TadD